MDKDKKELPEQEILVLFFFMYLPLYFQSIFPA